MGPVLHNQTPYRLSTLTNVPSTFVGPNPTGMGDNSRTKILQIWYRY